MMTPTRIVRLLGFAGLVAFFGLVASSRAMIQAQIDDGRPAPPPPPITADAPTSKPVLVSEPTDLLEPTPAAEPIAPLPIAPLPLPEPASEKPKATTARPIAENPEAAPIPRAPEPVGLEAASFGAEPQPIAEAAPAPATALVDDDALPLATEPPPADVVSASASDDPEKQAQTFVERSRKEAEAQLKALNVEAAQLRARLGKIESGIRRWQALADAMDRTEESASIQIQDLDPLPRAGRPTSNRRPSAAVIHSTPDDAPVTRAQFVPAPLPR